ncbi:uncharacterized protein FTOL_11429 [Fusarium torulosum]|uniref:Uncharacterized protein n=1 Tax=Fusarium torulosum TaxID=33205 RepID=A0AAE8SMZ3_9HYPO|nr:uncharacterized protein FTOL_11429 [Fusarium torulosum]
MSLNIQAYGLDVCNHLLLPYESERTSRFLASLCIRRYMMLIVSSLVFDSHGSISSYWLRQ